MTKIEDGGKRRGDAAGIDSTERAQGSAGDAREAAGVADNAGAPAGGSGTRGALAAVVGIVGELLITAGLVLALFVVYSLWWTNVLADREAQRAGSKVRDGWEQRTKGPGEIDIAGGIGFLHVPSMSKDEVLVKKGTDPEELNQGIAGYYTSPVKSALPRANSVEMPAITRSWWLVSAPPSIRTRSMK